MYVVILTLLSVLLLHAPQFFSRLDNTQSYHLIKRNCRQCTTSLMSPRSFVAVTQLLKDQPGSPRKVVKALNKYARTYLLDVVAEYKIAPVSLTGLIPSTRISSLSWTKRPWTYSHSRRGPENSFQRVRM